MKADYILKSKSIFDSTGLAPFDGYVVIKNNRILKVGKEEDLSIYTGCGNKVIDLGDKTLLAGFIDSHTHFFMGALSNSDMMCCDIFSSTSEENCIEIMKGFEKNIQITIDFLEWVGIWRFGLMRRFLLRKAWMKLFRTKLYILLMQMVIQCG